MLKAGTCLNRTYTLIEEIGSGGGGIVYKAYHENLKKYVVVKQIRDVAKEVLESRAEADILKNLRNSYLPQVYDFLEIEGEIFTVIDYIEGESLDKALVRERRFGQKEVLKWARQLAEALAYLHSQIPPIIHSDIKPANIMLTTKRDICLIDFNVSLAFDKNKRLSTGVSEGYSPPEQYWNYQMYYSITGATRNEHVSPNYHKTEYVPRKGGKDQQRVQSADKTCAGNRITKEFIGRGVDERSDIYSFGATLYHLLTGICPSGDFQQIIPLKNIKCQVSEGLARIVEKMMEVAPEKRYCSGAEALVALNNVRKLDSGYRKYKRNCILTVVSIITVYGASATLIGSGVRTMEKEKRNWYNQTLETAQSLIDEGEFKKAQACITEAMERIPSRIDAYEKEILRLYAEGKLDECIQYGRNAVNSPQYYINTESDQEKLGEILYIMGNAYYDTADYRNAQSCLELAITYNETNPIYYCDLGIVFAKTGNLDKASKVLLEAEKLGLSEGSVYMLRGEIAYTANRLDDARELFGKALNSLTSDRERLRCVLLSVNVFEQMGSQCIGREIDFLEQWKATLGHRGSMQIDEKLAEAYTRGQEYEKALESFLSLRQQGYQTYRLMENIAILYQQTEQPEKAEEILNEMNDLYPERYETYKRLAFLEADIQQRKANSDRDYIQMRVYYDKAEQFYQKLGTFDGEMEQLDRMMQELKEGNWFNE